MAKTKSARGGKKSLKRGKAKCEAYAQEDGANRAQTKKAKYKGRRISKSVTKPDTEEKRGPEIAETKLAETIVETTIIDVIEEPAPEVVVVEERKIA
jgi:hypothetical protein